MSEPLYIDEIIDRVLALSAGLPDEPLFQKPLIDLNDLHDRLAGGRLRIAVLGQFNRGKSSFINALLGLNVLPVSVLPITSVPTVIAHGKDDTCTIAFSDGKKPVVSQGNSEEIISLLANHVSEKNNPKNIKAVSSVTVTSASQFLNHGTVLIDTPGFGSTHVHNTDTTVSMLSTCDAALFLLSADLPITKVEIDFLKKVMPAVPRIFFIYNKTDLLKDDELAETQSFIKTTLKRDLGLTSEPTLFPVSVNKAVLDKKEGGFDVVEEEIVNFLLREKYFTLSQALSSRLKGAVQSIISGLEQLKADLLIPVNTAKETGTVLMGILHEIDSREKNSEARYLSNEEAHDLYFRKIGENRRRELEVRCDRIFKEVIVSAAQCRNGYHEIINSTTTVFLREFYMRCAIEFTAILNHHLVTAAYTEIEYLKRCAELTFSKIDVFVDIDEMYDPLISKVTLSAEDLAFPEIEIPLERPKKQLFSSFTQKAIREKRILETYAPVILATINTGYTVVLETVSSHINKLFEAFFVALKDDYENLRANIAGRITESEEMQKLAMSEIAEDITRIDELLAGYNELITTII